MGPQAEIARIKTALAGQAPASSDYDLNPGLVLPEGRKLKPAAVLMAIEIAQGRARVLLTKRSSKLKHHPGQVAFPGGKRDEGDASLVDAALREAWEEIGLPPDQVQIIGCLPCHETVTSYQVNPFIGVIEGAFTPRPELGEVAEIFTVPLAFLLDPASYRVERRRWAGDWRGYYVAPYGPYYIWGATARMLKGLADRVAP